jgi:myosin heavy subunit
VRFRDYGNSEDVSLSDLRAKGDDRDAIIAQLRAELASQKAPDIDAEREKLRETELTSLRAELASYKDAEQRASLLEETVASQAEEIRRLSEASQPADASDAASLFGAPPNDEVDQLKKSIQELEASDASEALAARVAESAQLQRRVQALEEETAAASTALQEANERLQTERAARKANEATLLEGSQQPVVDKSRRVRRKLRKQTSNFSRTMNELFDISDSILGELQAHEEDDSGDEDERVLDNLREKLPQAVDAVVARKVAEVTKPLEVERDEAKRECDSAVDDLADLEERTISASRRVVVPSLHCHESSPRVMDVGGLYFDFGASAQDCSAPRSVCRRPRPSRPSGKQLTTPTRTSCKRWCRNAIY